MRVDRLVFDEPGGDMPHGQEQHHQAERNPHIPRHGLCRHVDAELVIRDPKHNQPQAAEDRRPPRFRFRVVQRMTPRVMTNV